jgi:hypothetical protein
MEKRNMKRLVPQQNPDRPHDLELAKARFRVASIQSGPSEAVRRHPFSSLIGTLAATFAITGIFGSLIGRPSKEDSDHDRGTKPKKQAAGFRPPPGMMHWFLTMGMQLVQAYFTKTVADSRNKQDDSPQTSDRSDEATFHAQG